MQILPSLPGSLLHNVFGLPVDELAFFRVKVDSDHCDLLRGLKILLEVGFFLDLRQRDIVIVELELKQIDVIIRLDNRIDPTVVRTGFRVDIESEQPEDRVEDCLECRFALLVDVCAQRAPSGFEADSVVCSATNRNNGRTAWDAKDEIIGRSNCPNIGTAA